MDPWEAESWDEECVQEVAALPGVFVVRGDMCVWSLEAIDKYGRTGPAEKPTGWMTNSRRIAELLSARCPGGHQHVKLSKS